MRRLALLLAAVVLVACGDDGGAALPPGTTAPPGAVSTGEPPPSTAFPGEVVPPTTADVDGFEPDHVEPPPIGGVPGTAVPTVSEQRVALPGFGEVLVQVRTVDGEVVEWCLLLAETSAQTQRGLMEVTDPDLGGYDGMLFRFAEARGGGFYMRNTPQPLEIAYLAGDGAVVGIREMEPCDDVDGCPTYPPADGEFVRAVEVPLAAGGVRGLGITDDPAVEVVDTGRTCPATV